VPYVLVPLGNVASIYIFDISFLKLFFSNSPLVALIAYVIAIAIIQIAGILITQDDW